MGTSKSSIKEDLDEFLRQYRNAPHATTGQYPAQVFLGRSTRSRLNLIFPENVSTTVMQKQYMKFNANFRVLEVEQPVWFLSGNPRMNKWIRGVIIQRIGDLHYHIQYKDKICKQHIDQIKLRTHEGSVANENEKLTNQNYELAEKKYEHNEKDSASDRDYIHYYYPEKSDSCVHHPTEVPMQQG